MQSLPDGFVNVIHDEDKLHVGEAMSARREPLQKPVDKNTFSVSTLLLAIIFSNGITTATFLSAKEPLRQWLGIQEPTVFSIFKKTVDENIAALNTHDKNTATLITRIQQDLSRYGEELQQVRMMLDKAVNESAILKQEKQLLEEKIVHIKALPPKVIKSAAEIVEHPIPTALLMSIRIQGGYTFVTLREGLETSPLLSTGDSWHHWEFIHADPDSRKALFSVKGKSVELAL